MASKMDIGEDTNVKSMMVDVLDIITSVPELVSKSQLHDVKFKKKESVALVIITFRANRIPKNRYTSSSTI